MGNILLWVLGSGGVITAVVTLGIAIWERRSKKHEARKAARIAEMSRRREVCISLLATLREYGTVVIQLRSRHDSLLQRLVPLDPHLRQQMDALLKAMPKVASELTLDPEGEQVRHAAEAFVLAGNEYLQAITLAMRWPIGKADPTKLAQLMVNMDAKMAVLRDNKK